MSLIETVNDGPRIVSSTYWGNEYDRAGKLFVSVNAGAVRVLVPQRQRQMIEECRLSEYVILSRGTWPAAGKANAVELLFEDGSNTPFVLHLPSESFDRLPAEPLPGRDWALTLWELHDGKPHQALERVCYWRRVPRLPWLKPWKE